MQAAVNSTTDVFLHQIDDRNQGQFQKDYFLDLQTKVAKLNTNIFYFQGQYSKNVLFTISQIHQKRKTKIPVPKL